MACIVLVVGATMLWLKSEAKLRAPKMSAPQMTLKSRPSTMPAAERPRPANAPFEDPMRMSATIPNRSPRSPKPGMHRPSRPSTRERMAMMLVRGSVSTGCWEYWLYSPDEKVVMLRQE